MKNYKTVREYTEEYNSRPKNTMQRFLDAQNGNMGSVTVFEQATEELQRGKKVGHWMWYVFPQLRGLGRSETSDFFGLDNLADAKRFLENNVLYSRLYACFCTLLQLNISDPVSIFGHTDARKLSSCATLFAHTNPGWDKSVCDYARDILHKFFGGREDYKTKELMNHVNVAELAVRLRALIDPFDDFARAALEERFPQIHVPRSYIEPTQENLFAPEEVYIQKAMVLCKDNGVGYFRR